MLPREQTSTYRVCVDLSYNTRAILCSASERLRDRQQHGGNHPSRDEPSERDDQGEPKDKIQGTDPNALLYHIVRVRFQLGLQLDTLCLVFCRHSVNPFGIESGDARRWW